jgi:hypothetical protein
MKLTTILEQIGNNRYATPDDIRKVFGDYHNVALVGPLPDRRHGDCRQVCGRCLHHRPDPNLALHEWLVHWAARATLQARPDSALPDRGDRLRVRKPGTGLPRRLPLTAEHFQRLIENSEAVHTRLTCFAASCWYCMALQDSCDQLPHNSG